MIAAARRKRPRCGRASAEIILLVRGQLIAIMARRSRFGTSSKITPAEGRFTGEERFGRAPTPDQMRRGVDVPAEQGAEAEKVKSMDDLPMTGRATSHLPRDDKEGRSAAPGCPRRTIR
jgi:hypothetical protein